MFFVTVLDGYHTFRKSLQIVLAAQALCIESLWSLGQTVMKSELFTNWCSGLGKLGVFGTCGRTGGGRSGGAGGVKIRGGWPSLAFGEAEVHLVWIEVDDWAVDTQELLTIVDELLLVLTRSWGTREARWWASREGTEPSAKLSAVPSEKWDSKNYDHKQSRKIFHSLLVGWCWTGMGTGTAPMVAIMAKIPMLGWGAPESPKTGRSSPDKIF